MLLSETSETNTKPRRIVLIRDFSSLMPRPGWQDKDLVFL